MAVDAKTRGLQVLETLYPDPTVRQARAEELGEAGIATLGTSLVNSTAAALAAYLLGVAVRMTML